MKKHFKIVSGALAALTLALFIAGAAAKAEKKECVRLHILANSDSEADQLVKLKVRDALLERMRGEELASKREAEERIRLIGPELRDIAEEVLAASGFDYGVSLQTGVFDFPERDYGGEVYPAGEYSALRVILGEGKGRNWWCVMFPPLCVIDDGSGVSKNPDGTLEFRSLILDFIRSIFG